jgi:predicted DNA-binding transcriptional regulator AlpA
MSGTNAKLSLMTLPDWAVISDQRAAEILDLSLDTLWRLDRAGDGPPRVRLSPRRHGRTIGTLREWLARRTAVAATRQAKLNHGRQQLREA